MEKSQKSDRLVIIGLLIFVFVATAGVIGYLYIIAEPKRHPDEPKVTNEPTASNPVNKGQQVPLPDAEPSQPSQPKEQKTPQPDAEPSIPQEQALPEPPSEDTKTSEPMRITSGVVQPVLIHKVNPEYPEFARKARVEGVVILEAIITKNGNVENARVLRGVHPMLDQAAVNAVMQWRYKPATLNGKPVKVYSTITVKFKLR